MPELPDVEVFNKYLRKKALRKKIRDVEVENSHIIKGAAKKFAAHVKNTKIEETYRRGKYLFGKLDSKEAVVFHFGMTGYFEYTKDGPPPYSLVKFSLDDGHLLSFVMKRKLGKVELTDDIDDYCEKKRLGPDALDIAKKQFREIFQKRSGKVKAALMDQSLLAGIGNIYSDEILFHSRILPERKCNGLSEREIGNLHSDLRKILKKATGYLEKGGGFPGSWLINHRKEGRECPRCGGRITRKKINSRGSYFCKSCQK